LQKRMMSSAKNRWLIHGPLGDVGTLMMIPLLSAYVRSELRTSAQRRKRCREMGSPCRMPLVGRMLPTGEPLTMTEYCTDFTHTITSCTHIVSNPILSIAASRKLHSTRSYALFISSLRPIKLVLLHIQVCIECIVS
jgi:hypothetical protein